MATTTPTADPEAPALAGDAAPSAGAPPPVATSPEAAPERTSWLRRHPQGSRVVLYGVLVAVIATAWVLLAQRAKEMEEDRQKGLVTRLQGVSDYLRHLAPEDALKVVRDEILAKSPNDDVRLKARLEEAAILDQLKRWVEAEKAYAAIGDSWPRGTPRGALYMPWATMRVRAGRVDEGLALLDLPGATDGFTDAEVASLRAAAEERRVKDRSR